MRIEKLDQNTRKNLLETLLKRSPNSYGKYEDSVREILNTVKEKRDQALFEYTEKIRWCKDQCRKYSCDGSRDQRSL